MQKILITQKCCKSIERKRRTLINKCIAYLTSLKIYKNNKDNIIMSCVCMDTG